MTIKCSKMAVPCKKPSEALQPWVHQLRYIVLELSHGKKRKFTEENSTIYSFLVITKLESRAYHFCKRFMPRPHQSSSNTRRNCWSGRYDRCLPTKGLWFKGKPFLLIQLQWYLLGWRHWSGQQHQRLRKKRLKMAEEKSMASIY